MHHVRRFALGDAVSPPRCVAASSLGRSRESRNNRREDEFTAFLQLGKQLLRQRGGAVYF